MARVSIEDCQKFMPNRFALVVVAANRTRQLMSSSMPLVQTKNKPAVTALREIAEGKITMKGNFTQEQDVYKDEPESFLFGDDTEK
jgi:DNA-directed RNA polymerase subunit omega